MTATPTATLPGVAAGAALGVPGVACLQPRFARRLAALARGRVPPHPASLEEGVRADRARDGAGWRIEVRCVLAEGPRALDVARNVRDRVRTAVVSHLAAAGAAEPVTVAVTVTRVAARPDLDGAPFRESTAC